MTLSQRFHARMALVSLLVGGLGVVNWIVRPEKALVSVITAGAMVGVWVATAAMLRRHPLEGQTEAQRRFFTLNGVLGGLMLAVPIGVGLVGELESVNGSDAGRIVGIVTGMVLALIGNRIPKVLGPVHAERASTRPVQSYQRFAGWCLTLAGLAFAAAFVLVDDPGQAALVGAALVTSSLAIVFVRTTREGC